MSGDERASAIAELLGDAGEFAFEGGEAGAQWRPVCLTQLLGARGRGGKRIGMLAARAQKTDHRRFERGRGDVAHRALRVPALFNRWANRRLLSWRNRPHHTTTDFIAQLAADHDRRALSAILSRSFPS